jgi:hypothetical protein
MDQRGGGTEGDAALTNGHGTPAHGVVPRDHVVQFYAHDDELIEPVCTFLADGLLAGEAAIVVATPAHLVALEIAMTAAGVDVVAARTLGTLVTADAAQTLSRVMPNGLPNARTFESEVGELVRRTVGSGRRLRIYGEMVALLWDSGRVAEAIELEGLWNEIGREIPFSLYCAYQAQHDVDDEWAASFGRVCHLHSAVIGGAVRTASIPAAVIARADDARSFLCEARSSSLARGFVADRLFAWGRPALVDDALIVVAELATNAVLHAQSEFIVSLSCQQATLRVSVRDASSALPALQDPNPDSLCGRGLVLVSAVAERWGTELIVDGKVVWAELSDS